MRQTDIKGKAIILRIIQAQEADVIVALLTSDGQKLKAFAKAGLKSKKRFGGALTPLAHVSFRAVNRTAKELMNLEELVLHNDFYNLRNHLENLSAASYAAELLENCAQDGLSNPELYNLLGAFLKALESEFSSLSLLRQFEVKLLAILGWLPQFQKCSHCNTNEGDFTLHPQQGFVACAGCARYLIPLKQNTRHSLQRLLGSRLSQAIELSNATFKETGRITCGLLENHFNLKKMRTFGLASRVINP